MRKPHLALLAGVIALAALTTGCGSSSEAEVLTKAQYVKQANTICKRLNEESAAKYESFYKTHKKANSAELRRTLATVYLPAVEARLTAIDELVPPAQGEKKVEAMVAAFQTGIENATVKHSIPFQNTQEAFEKANKLALSYGLTYCYSA